MSKSNEIQVDLEYDLEVITVQSAAELIYGIIESILYQRNQIPFVFKTFNYLISKWKDESSEDNIVSYNIEKQRTLAKSTLNSINVLKEAIFQELEHSTVNCIRLLFGSTVATPREVYIIKLPKISKTHNHDNHKATVEPLIKRLLMSIQTCEKLFNIFSRNLPATNMFLDIQMERDSKTVCQNFFQKEEVNLPSKCCKVVFDIQHRIGTENSLNCCGQFKVFRDLENLSISDEEGSHLDVPHKNKVWMEANSFVRGFRDVAMKGRSVWQS